MQNKEIEEAKGCLSALDIKNEYEAISKEILLQYIEQLETKEQKLIEKLEKVREDMEQDQYTEMYYLQDIKEILKIVKGEKDE